MEAQISRAIVVPRLDLFCSTLPGLSACSCGRGLQACCPPWICQSETGWAADVAIGMFGAVAHPEVGVEWTVATPAVKGQPVFGSVPACYSRGSSAGPMWMDEIQVVPPQNTWNDASPVDTNKPWFTMVSKWCRISSTHSSCHALQAFHKCERLSAVRAVFVRLRSTWHPSPSAPPA